MSQAQEHRIAIAARLKIPRLGLGSIFSPSGNVIGLLLLFRGISKELQLQGILGNFSAWAGTLEDGALVYEVNDRAKGLAVVQSELELCLLLKLCAIGWFAEDELIWRQYYPAKSGDAMPGFDFEEIKKLLEAANRHLHPWWATIFKRA